MKIDPMGKGIISEGKLLEIMPLIMTDEGVPFMLPPTVYPVPNWLLGFRDDHIVHTPISFGVAYGSWHIPGSSSARVHRIEFLGRILENSSPGVSVATVDETAVQALIEAIKKR